VALAAALALLALPLLLPSAAHAADAYRYWTYWWGQDGSWEYASTGPADREVLDGSVEGWLFQVSADPVPAVQPGPAPVFDDLCPDLGPGPQGQVRVAVVVDYGSATDAPEDDAPPEPQERVSCLLVPAGSTGEQALAAAGQVRLEDGLTCGIGGYPATGCGDIVTEAELQAAEEAAQGQGSGSLRWALIGVAVLAVALVVALLTRRRRPSDA
jgi:hypothetical protein